MFFNKTLYIFFTPVDVAFYSLYKSTKALMYFPCLPYGKCYEIKVKISFKLTVSGTSILIRLYIEQENASTDE